MHKKMSIVTQKEAKDCGPCTILSVILYYDGYVPLNTIKDDVFLNKNGTTIYHVVMALRKYGFDAVAKRNPDKEIKSLKFPMIVHMHYKNGLNHFMVLYEITNNKYILMDPAKGKVKFTEKEFFDIFTGIYIEISPRSKIIYMEKDTKIYDFFLSVIKDNKILISNIIICSILMMLFTIIYSFYFKFSYEVIVNKINFINYNSLLLIFFTFLIFKLIIENLKNYYVNHLNKNIDVNVIGSFVKHIFYLPSKVINSKASGEIISRVNELTNVKNFISEFFVSLVINLLLAIGSFIVLININKYLGAMAFIIIFLYILFFLIISPFLYKKIKENIDFQTSFNTIFLENINMLNTFKYLNKLEFADLKNEKALSNLIYNNYKLTKLINKFEFIKNSLIEIGMFIINITAFKLIMKNELTLINLLLFNTIITYFIESIKKIISYLPTFNFFKASYFKICDYINIQEEKINKLDNFVNGDIEFRNIKFSYNGYYNIINNLDLSIKKGEKIIIYGKSGVGKSTLFKFLEKVYLPDSGTIIINNKNINDYGLFALRKHINYVSQKENLFTGTLKDNILLDKKENSYFDKICEICAINQIVDKKAFRYEFGIEGSDCNLSGGEKQRIVLARTLLQNSEILILDEALSELDIDLERKIINNLIFFFPHKTIIYISHKRHHNLFDREINFEELNHERL